MLFKRLGLAALVAAGLIPSVLAQDDDNESKSTSSTFVNADRAIGFSFAVPEGNEDQFYFTLRVHRTHAWGAIGLGADDMPGALYLMVYDNSRQTNVTFSPRIAFGYHEPAYHPDFEYELLEETGIYDEHMVVVGRCLRNCMTWPNRGTKGGKIDVNSTSEKGIYALGPLEGFASDRHDESLKFHVQYGSFYMDMSRAHGATEPPMLTDSSKSDGAQLDKKYVQKADVMSTMHAVFMLLSIVLLMPLGAVMIRLGNWVKWHAYNQTFAMVLVLVGFGIGIATSYRYQRSRDFKSYHQILGFFIVFFILFQFALGLLHHRQYRRTQMPTSYGKFHPWVGRLVLLLGIMNGFFGFTFALNRRYGIILAGLVIAMCFAIFVVIVGRRWLNHHARNSSQPRNGQWPPPNGNRPHFGPQAGAGSWQYPMPPGHDMPGQPPPHYEPPPRYEEPPQQNIGLRQVVAGLRSTEPRSQERRPGQRGWDNPQAPRELV
ncbi:hypothetical protein ACRE_044910 [Hapsidospora chrysogenum ATCC 11550]|uniref:Cytochrome b561 domain-containing protein n=1 Tax=Hapsidospora chrysogenum (strain ATCC 11550 / CBS 779.69 / DSM 880 / IAM 14645 / JCM 23072 / IMI 49137) TaxID=857340 RepID=A0A086T5U8_HAPC1|nr:hypothetical protein ACRE_044910 [Hapsidospora chrysogenum ATCC 11550]